MDIKTPTAIALERISAETGFSASAVLAHIGSKRRLQKMFATCCSLATTVWATYDPDENKALPDPEGTEAIWIETRDVLLNGIERNNIA